MKHLLRWGIFVLAATASLTAGADIRDLNDDADGSGKLRIRGRDYSLTSASIKLNRDGSFDLTLRAGKEDWKIRGDWNRQSGNRATLTATIGAINGVRAAGMVSSTGRDELDDFVLQSLNGDFRASFTARRGGGGLRPPSGGHWDGQFEGAVFGEGTYRHGGQTRRIREARVRLTKSGKADVWLVMTDGFNLQLDGEWFDRRGDKVDLRIEDAGREGNSEARGQITFDRENRLFRIDIDGRIGRDNADIRFERRDNGDWNDNNAWFDVDQSKNGRGYVEGRNGRGDINRVSVRLNKNGTFDVTLRGNRAYRYTGRYTRRGNNAELVVTGGGIGTGLITVARNQIGKVEFDLVDDNEKLKFRFTAQ